MKTDLTYRKIIEVVELSEGDVLQDGELRVTALRVDHPPVTEGFALRFEN